MFKNKQKQVTIGATWGLTLSINFIKKIIPNIFMKVNVIKRFILTLIVALSCQSVMAGSYIHQTKVKYECANLENQTEYARCQFNKRGTIEFIFKDTKDEQEVLLREYLIANTLESWKLFGGVVADYYNDGSKKYKHCRFSRQGYGFSCEKRSLENSMFFKKDNNLWLMN